MALDYARAARETLEAVGGAQNVVSAAHCATRLRLVIADNSKVDKAAVDEIEGAKGNFEASGQLQIIFGTGTVNKVYEEFIKQGGITAASKEEAKAAVAEQQNFFMRAIKTLSDVFVPIIPAIVASGMLMGIMGGIEFMGNSGIIALDTNSVWWRIAGLINACALANLQILLGFSAASVFGGNPYLGASFGALLISGSFINAYGAADAIANGEMISLEVIPGLYSIDWIGYQGHVIPILVGTWILCFFEKKLHQIVPEMFDLFVTPLLSMAGAAYITILFVGPVFVWLENAILGLLTALLAIPFGIGYIIIGLIYSPSVVTGLHQMYTTIDVSMLGQYGVTYWLPIASAANIAQGGACLAVAIKTKNPKTKALAVPSGISCLLGITEPAIFGVNLPKFKPFVAGMIGAAVGAFICSLTQLHRPVRHPAVHQPALAVLPDVRRRLRRRVRNHLRRLQRRRARRQGVQQGDRAGHGGHRRRPGRLLRQDFRGRSDRHPVRTDDGHGGRHDLGVRPGVRLRGHGQGRRDRAHRGRRVRTCQRSDNDGRRFRSRRGHHVGRRMRDLDPHRHRHRRAQRCALPGQGPGR